MFTSPATRGFEADTPGQTAAVPSGVTTLFTCDAAALLLGLSTTGLTQQLRAHRDALPTARYVPSSKATHYRRRRVFTREELEQVRDVLDAARAATQARRAARVIGIRQRRLMKRKRKAYWLGRSA